MDLVAPDAPDLQSATTFIAAPGGAPGNVACAVAHLGGRSQFIGVIGNDAFGERLRDTLHDFGAGLDGLRILEGRTSLALVASGGEGIPDFVFYRDADAALSPDDIDEAAVAGASFLYISSMALQAQPGRSAILKAIDLAKRHGTYICYDPNIRLRDWPSADAARMALEPVTRAADILKVNGHDALILTGVPDPAEALPLLGNPHALVVITLGKAGCLWRRGDDSGSIPGFTVKAVETTGAGDAFAAALLFQLAGEEGPLQEISTTALDAALRFACAAGALACTKPGAVSALPTYEQVTALLAAASPTVHSSD